MEQHSAPLREPSRRRPVPSQAKLPRPARQARSRPAAPRKSAAVYRARPPVVARLPGPRLTALGGGLLAVLAMVLVGGLDTLLLGGSPAVYGVCFVLVSGAVALWVRPADVLTAPIAVPIAFTAGLVFISEGGEGFGGRVMGLITALATHAGWVYGGTLVALLIALGRKWLLVRQRRLRRARG